MISSTPGKIPSSFNKRLCDNGIPRWCCSCREEDVDDDVDVDDPRKKRFRSKVVVQRRRCLLAGNKPIILFADPGITSRPPYNCAKYKKFDSSGIYESSGLEV